jgi:hypothetical protein
VTKQLSLPAFVVFFTSSLALAQHNCPQNFQYAGTLSGTGSYSSELNERREISFPAAQPSIRRTNKPMFDRMEAA